MLAATVYGVVQVFVLASPTRTTRLRTALLVGINVRSRLQHGLTDYVVLGAGLGAGFALLEAFARFGMNAGLAIPLAGGGWILPSLTPPYIPGLDQILSTAFPAPVGPLEIADITKSRQRSVHRYQHPSGLDRARGSRCRSAVAGASMVPAAWSGTDRHRLWSSHSVQLRSSRARSCTAPPGQHPQGPAVAGSVARPGDRDGTRPQGAPLGQGGCSRGSARR